jgi:hypothetical protein
MASGGQVPVSPGSRAISRSGTPGELPLSALRWLDCRTTRSALSRGVDQDLWLLHTLTDHHWRRRNNHAMHGTAFACDSQGRQVVTSQTEHPVGHLAGRLSGEGTRCHHRFLGHGRNDLTGDLPIPKSPRLSGEDGLRCCRCSVSPSTSVGTVFYCSMPTPPSTFGVRPAATAPISKPSIPRRSRAPGARRRA